MTEEFAPSPRASKRRRTTSYKAEQSVFDETRVQDDTEDATTQQSTPTRRTAQGKKARARQLVGDLAVEDDTGFDGDDTVIVQDHDENIQDDVQPRSSGRERRKPRRYEISPEKPKRIRKNGAEEVRPDKDTKQQEQADTLPALRGILTPSKGRRAGPRKSVGFDTTDKAIAEQFGFRDIDDSTPTKQAVDVPSPSKLSKPPRRQLVTPKSKNKTITSTSTSTGQKSPSKSSVQTTPTIPHPTPSEDEDDLVFDQLLESQYVTRDSPPPIAKAIKDITFQDEPTILAIKTTILSRLLCRTSTTMPAVPDHLQTAYKSIHNLLTATITTGESNSMLILGARGSGKSLLLNTALADLNTKHPHDFHTVRLNGFLQTDDKLALREIWRQLGREMNVDRNEGGEETEKIGSYADTMASLLALLSHAEDHLEPEAELDSTAMTTTTRLSKSVVFILDEFDLFTTHPRQTLLYNLFDIAQSRKAPIVVMGCSTRMDAVECLEKRVKSRFSHRWVHVPQAKSFDGFVQIVKQALQIDPVRHEEGNPLSQEDTEARKLWNTCIETRFLTSKPVQSLLQRTFYTSKSVPDLLAALYLSVASLDVSSEAGKMLTSSASAPHVVMVLPSLPTLQLSLLVAAARLDTIHNLSAVNFNLVYHHYADLITRSKLQQTASGAVAVGAGVRQWTREMAQEGWEDLGSWNLIVPAQGSHGAGGRDAHGAEAVGGEGASVRMWKVDVTLDDLVWALKEKSDLGGAAAGAAEVLSKWCREI